MNLPAVLYCAESISPQHHTAGGESCDFSGSYLKGYSNKISDFQFFTSFKPGTKTNGLKYFWFWLRFRWVSQIFCKKSPCSIILRWVRLPVVSYCAESVSPKYNTALSQSPRSIILRRVSLPAVLYCWGVNHDPGKPFLKTFAQAFKGAVSQKYMWILILLIKGYILHFC